MQKRRNNKAKSNTGFKKKIREKATSKVESQPIKQITVATNTKSLKSKHE